MHKRCTIHADITTWERRHWMIDENLDRDVFRKLSTWYYLLCHIYKINIIKISWISAFYSYLNLKYLPSAFRMKMLDFESQFPQVLVNRFPWFKFGRKCDSLIWLDAKYQGFTWPWTWQHSSLKWSCISHVLPVNVFSRNSDFFSEISHFFSQLKKYIHSINMTPISLKSPFN
jgi:hypothetical protein